jgi:hypothetical protein
MKRVPPVLHGNRTVEQKGIKSHLLRIALRPTNHENRGDVITPLNPPIGVVSRSHPKEIRGAGGESPNLRRGETSAEQPLNH